MRVRMRMDQSGRTTKTLDVAGASIRFGRGAECEVAVDPVVFPKVSEVHARIEPAASGFVLVHLSRSNKTLLNDAAMACGCAVRPAGECGAPGRTRHDGELLLTKQTSLPADDGNS